MTEPTPISELITAALPEGGLDSRLVHAWKKACPSRLHPFAIPIKLDGAQLVVGVYGAAARQEILLHTGQILRELAQRGWVIERLRVVNLPTPPPPPPPPPPERTPSAQELDKARSIATKASDPALARRLYRAMVAQLKRG